MCFISRRRMHADIGENGRQPIDPSAIHWDEMRAPFSLAALRANGAANDAAELHRAGRGAGDEAALRRRAG